eukprot:CAMPEP_0170562998 /NCGR_PEP_ID=MMETSP0211-20121228/63611_1 /TAXON_ID=311385 /ORGANISM="Pseudokeronopsis sp., Strain OXSARD2" /LENGTH=56 /DNA_ID=CAMNT_0010880617 /DNA_START=12 /DNA_END=178 /DNA_ORIENTATION=+
MIGKEREDKHTEEDIDKLEDVMEDLLDNYDSNVSMDGMEKLNILKRKLFDPELDLL